MPTYVGVSFSVPLKKAKAMMSAVDDLVDGPSISVSDKPEKSCACQIGTRGAVKGLKPNARQRGRCDDIGLVVFRLNAV